MWAKVAKKSYNRASRGAVHATEPSNNKETEFGAAWRTSASPEHSSSGYLCSKSSHDDRSSIQAPPRQEGWSSSCCCVSTELMTKLRYAYFWAPLDKESAQESPKQWPSLWFPFASASQRMQYHDHRQLSGTDQCQTGVSPTLPGGM